MNELEQHKDDFFFNKLPDHHELLSLYDTYSSMAYGVILQIIPQQNLAQDTLVNVFSTLSVNECKNCAVGSAIYIIRKARIKAIEVKNKLSNFVNDQIPNGEVALREIIFELSFQQGHTPEVIAQRLNVPKTQVLKAIYEHFKLFRQV